MINWNVYIFECLGMIVFFTGIIMIPLCKNPIWWIHDYPEDIQEVYFTTHERIPTKMFSPTVALKKGFALLLTLGIMSLLMKLAGASGFLTAFSLSYGIWLIIDWYDCFFLDWVLFANIRKIRLPGTEHMDKAYHQKKYHVIRSIMGMGLGLIPCLLCGVIFAIIF